MKNINTDNSHLTSFSNNLEAQLTHDLIWFPELTICYLLEPTRETWLILITL